MRPGCFLAAVLSAGETDTLSNQHGVNKVALHSAGPVPQIADF